jgi:hypothetical protein
MLLRAGLPSLIRRPDIVDTLYFPFDIVDNVPTIDAWMEAGAQTIVRQKNQIKSAYYGD